uniref:Uncharacterized protein n=1 Tax=Oryza punctata TaxID=4537 RepID=A0A0E0JFW8_ORYPU
MTLLKRRDPHPRREPISLRVLASPARRHSPRRRVVWVSAATYMRARWRRRRRSKRQASSSSPRPSLFLAGSRRSILAGSVSARTKLDQIQSTAQQLDGARS